MNTITLDIRQGNWVVNVADVTLDEDKIVNVLLRDDRHVPVSTTTAEAQRRFWTTEHARMGMTLSPHEVIDSTYEDRCDMMTR